MDPPEGWVISKRPAHAARPAYRGLVRLTEMLTLSPLPGYTTVTFVAWVASIRHRSCPSLDEIRPRRRLFRGW